MSTSSLQKENKKATLGLLWITMLLALIFLVNKYFEWGAKFDHGIIPGSYQLTEQMSQGEILFFGLYFVMTGLHALHIIVGMVLIGITIFRVGSGSISANRPVMLENTGLYWHLVDIIWIFLFPLFYLIA